MQHQLRILFLSLSIVAAAVHGQQLIWSDPIVVHRGDQDPIRPRIVLNGDQQPVVLWGEASPGANFIAVGEGNSFSVANQIHPGGIQPAAEYWQGSDLASYGNSIHAVMKLTPEISGGIYVVSSYDGGYTWSDTLRVDQVPGYKTRFSSIAVNGNGEPLVQYMRIDLDEIGHRTMVSRIVDGSVQAPIDVSSPFTAGEDCDCCPGQIMANGDRVAALFRDATENMRVIWAAISNDGGATFDQGAQIDPTDWVLNACPSSGADGVIDGDRMRYVWMSGANEGKKIFYGSADGDLADIAVMQVHPDQPQSVAQDHPRLAGSGDTLGVAWQQNAAAQTEVLFTWKLPGMVSFQAPDTVNVELAGPQRSPDVAFSNNMFHLVWADYQENAVMYRTATIAPSIGMQEKEIGTIAIWPVPADDRLHLDTQDLPRVATVRIYSAIGALVRSLPLTPSIDVSSLAPGWFTLSIEDGNGVRIARGKVLIAR